jgi:hypothetical protein
VTRRDIGFIPSSDGRASAARFSGPGAHRAVADAEHNLPEEAPGAFAGAVWELISAHL